MNAVIIGRSHNVGLPIQIILGADGVKGGCDMTTTLCHRHTPLAQLHSALASAHLVVSAAGVPGLLHRNIIRPGSVIIDVGLNRVSGRLVGDAADNVREVASLVTPVPGGVGPCTVACLMHNTFIAAKATLQGTFALILKQVEHFFMILSCYIQVLFGKWQMFIFRMTKGSTLRRLSTVVKYCHYLVHTSWQAVTDSSH